MFCSLSLLPHFRLFSCCYSFRTPFGFPASTNFARTWEKKAPQFELFGSPPLPPPFPARCFSCLMPMAAHESTGPRRSTLSPGELVALLAAPEGTVRPSAASATLLDPESHLDPSYRLRRSRALRAFELWLSARGVPYAALAQSGVLLAHAIRLFGVFLYDVGAARYWLTDTINVVSARHPEWRTYMGPAWQIDRSWNRLHPGASRINVPAGLLRAMVSVSLLWSWSNFAALLLLAFCGMLRPSEVLNARRRHLVFASDRLAESGDVFLHLVEPKTKRFARLQHARISDPDVCLLLQASFGSLHPDAPLAPWGASAFRSRWNAVLDKLGVPSRRDSGPTPGSLRGSGATELYIQLEDIPRIAWRGRWRRVETLEYYLQEVAAQLTFVDLPAASRSLVLRFGAAAPDLVRLFIHIGSPGLWQSFVLSRRNRSRLVSAAGRASRTLPGDVSLPRPFRPPPATAEVVPHTSEAL